MSSSSFDHSLRNSTTYCDDTAISPFHNLHFKTIGQPPDLLKRMSIPNPEIGMYEDYETERASFSPEPDLANELIPQESSGNTPDLPKQPSLTERLALAPGSVLQTNISQNANVLESQPGQSFSHRPKFTNGTTGFSASSHQPRVTLTPIEATQRLSHKSPLRGDAAISTQNSDTTKHLNSIQSGEAKSQEATFDSLRFSDASASTTKATNPILNTFADLQPLQDILSTALDNVDPLDLEHAVILAHATEDQCAKALTSANRAYSLAEESMHIAEKAIKAAQDSMNAAKESLEAAEITRIRTDDVVAALEQIGHRGQELRENQNKITVGLRDLDEWKKQAMSKLEAQEIERQRQQTAGAYNDAGPMPRRTPSGTSSCRNDPALLHNSRSSDHSQPSPTPVDNTAIDRALSKIDEEAAEKKRKADDEIRKSREAEEKILADLAAEKARRLAVEKKQIQDAHDAELRRQVLFKQQEEARRYREASEELVKRTAQDSKGKGKETRSHRLQPREQEHDGVFHAPVHELNSRHEIAARKPRAAIDEVQQTQFNFAKSKQAQTQLEKATSVHTGDLSLPSTPPVNGDSLHQVSSGVTNSDKKTETTALENFHNDKLFNHIAASATSSNRPLTAISRYPNSDLDRQLLRPSAPNSTVLGIAATDAMQTFPPLSEQYKSPQPEKALTLANRAKVPPTQQTHNIKHLPRSNGLQPPIGLPIKPNQDHSSSEHSIQSSRHNSGRNVENDVQIKVELQDEDDLMNSEHAIPATVSSQASKVPQTSDQNLISENKRKSESPGIPLLSLPSPPPEDPLATRTLSSIEQTQRQERGNPRPNLTDNKLQNNEASNGPVFIAPGSSVTNSPCPVSNTRDVPIQNIAVQQLNEPSERLVAFPRRNTPPPANLPTSASTCQLRNGTPPYSSQRTTAYDIGHTTPYVSQQFDYELSSRMGLDTITPGPLHENVQDVRLPRKPITGPRLSPPPVRHIDRYPSPHRNMNNRNQRQRARPTRRSQSPLLAYNRHASPIHSPSPEFNYRMGSPEYQPHIGAAQKRKRPQRYDQFQDSGPPQRRRRVDQSNLGEGSYSRSGPRFPTASVRNDHQADWSNIANYSRSPTPESSHPPPLPRMEENDRTYRPADQRAYNRQSQYQSYDHRPPTLHSGPQRGNEPDHNHRKNNMSPNVQEPPSDGSYPVLLSRLASPPADPLPNLNNNHVQHSGPSRGHRGRGRGGANQTSGPRMPKLIDRLELQRAG